MQWNCYLFDRVWSTTFTCCWWPKLPFPKHSLHAFYCIRLNVIIGKKTLLFEFPSTWYSSASVVHLIQWIHSLKIWHNTFKEPPRPAMVQWLSYRLTRCVFKLFVVIISCILMGISYATVCPQAIFSFQPTKNFRLSCRYSPSGDSIKCIVNNNVIIDKSKHCPPWFYRVI